MSSPKSKSCLPVVEFGCGWCTLPTRCRILGYVHLTIALSMTVYICSQAFLKLGECGDNQNCMWDRTCYYFLWMVADGCAGMAVCLLLLHGLKKQKPSLLQPYVVYVSARVIYVIVDQWLNYDDPTPFLLTLALVAIALASSQRSRMLAEYSSGAQAAPAQAGENTEEEAGSKGMEGAAPAAIASTIVGVDDAPPTYASVADSVPNPVSNPVPDSVAEGRPNHTAAAPPPQ